QLYRYAGVPTWEPYSSTVDTVGNTVTATIHEFSPWAIGAPGHEPTAVSLRSLAWRAAGSLRVPPGAILGVGALCLAGWWTLGRRHGANERSPRAR
ncbi:MAG: hypothetical protein JW850_16815, partial [Thermoflexales bacterium]|nr:hypothetical protein [Thermoflexales bacterium]